MPPHLLATELNLTASLISLAIGGALLVAVGYIDRRVRRADLANASTTTPADAPASVTPTQTKATTATTTKAAAAPAPAPTPPATPKAVPLRTALARSAPTSPLDQMGTKVADPEVIDLTDPNGTAPVLASALPLAEATPADDGPRRRAEEPARDDLAPQPAAQPEAAAEPGLDSEAEPEAEPEAAAEDDVPDVPDVPRAPMPRGAEAAILSIIEAVPDPRNTIAVKDPTAEVRVKRVSARPASAPDATPSTSAGPPTSTPAVAPRAGSGGTGRWSTVDDATRVAPAHPRTSVEPSPFL